MPEPGRRRGILHIIGTAQRSHTPIARIVRDLHRNLESDWNFEVWFLGGPGPLVEEMAAEGVTVRPVEWSGSGRDLGGMAQFVAAARGRSFDLVHSHHGGRAAAHLARFLARPRLLHLHSRVDGTGSSPRPIPTRGWSAVAADCEAIAEVARGLVPRVVHIGIEPGSPPDHAARNTVPTIGFCGRLEPIKGVDTLLQAFQIVLATAPETRLEIVGTGSLFSSLQSSAHALGIENRVSFLGWRDDVRQFIRRWELFAQPSIEEGFPVTVLEAMAEGVPVVASRVGGLPEMIEPDQNGWLVEPGNKQDLALRLSTALGDIESLRAVGMRGRSVVNGRFSARAMSQGIASLYEELLSPSASGSPID